MTRRATPPTAAELLKQLAAVLEQQPPANDGEPTPEEVEQLRELARQDAEEMRRARRR